MSLLRGAGWLSSGRDCIGFLFSKPFPIRGGVVLPLTISGKSHETDPLAPHGGASSSPPHVARSVRHKPVTSEVTLLTGCLQTHDPCHERSHCRRPDLATSQYKRLLTRNHLHAIGRSTLQYNITRARNTPPSLGHCSLLPQLTGLACRASPQRCSSPPGADSPNPSLSSMFDRTGALTGLASFLRCLERQMVRAQ